MLAARSCACASSSDLTFRPRACSKRPTPPQCWRIVQERLVRFRASTILAVLGIAIAVALLLEILWIARQVLTWILIAIFLALALNPAVDWFQRHGVKRRGLATGLRSEEHTSELQSRGQLVCRLLLEK